MVANSTISKQAAREETQPELESRLQHLALQLEAVLSVHLEKEERIYLPLFERYVAQEEQQQVLDDMHAAYEK